MNKNISFISFTPEASKFKGLLSLDIAFDSKNDPQSLIRKSELIYEKHIREMQIIIQNIKKIRSSNSRISARDIWILGDSIFSLKRNLENIGLQVDDLYTHLMRDLGVKRKWLEKVVILRRYVFHKKTIPKSSNWGRFEKGTAKKAKLLQENS